MMCYRLLSQNSKKFEHVHEVALDPPTPPNFCMLDPNLPARSTGDNESKDNSTM